jgi:hypothetical protein
MLTRTEVERDEDHDLLAEVQQQSALQPPI